MDGGDMGREGMALKVCKPPLLPLSRSAVSQCPSQLPSWHMMCALNVHVVNSYFVLCICSKCSRWLLLTSGTLEHFMQVKKCFSFPPFAKLCHTFIPCPLFILECIVWTLILRFFFCFIPADYYLPASFPFLKDQKPISIIYDSDLSPFLSPPFYCD